MLGDRDWDPQVQMHVAFKETSPIGRCYSFTGKRTLLTLA